MGLLEDATLNDFSTVIEIGEVVLFKDGDGLRIEVV